MTAQKRKPNRLLRLVILSGAALAVSGNWENPLTIFSSQGEQSGRPNEGFAPHQNAQAATNPPQWPAGGDGGQDENSAGISWSQFGHILYDIWFLFAAAVVSSSRRRCGPSASGSAVAPYNKNSLASTGLKAVIPYSFKPSAQSRFRFPSSARSHRVKG